MKSKFSFHYTLDGISGKAEITLLGDGKIDYQSTTNLTDNQWQRLFNHFFYHHSLNGEIPDYHELPT